MQDGAAALEFIFGPTWNNGASDLRKPDGVSFTPIANLAANSTGYASTGLTSQTTYCYRMLAITSTGGSAYGNGVSAKTQ